jgi:hypothetical protein
MRRGGGRDFWLIGVAGLRGCGEESKIFWIKNF